MNVQPRRALRAVAAIHRNPDDTAQVFALIEALSGVRTPQRIVRRLGASAGGARLLRERPDIAAALGDRSALARLPAGSLAHAYLRFVESEGISADGLREASRRGERETGAGSSDVQ